MNRKDEAKKGEQAQKDLSRQKEDMRDSKKLHRISLLIESRLGGFLKTDSEGRKKINEILKSKPAKMTPEQISQKLKTVFSPRPGVKEKSVLINPLMRRILGSPPIVTPFSMQLQGKTLPFFYQSRFRRFFFDVKTAYKELNKLNRLKAVEGKLEQPQPAEETGKTTEAQDADEILKQAIGIVPEDGEEPDDAEEVEKEKEKPAQEAGEIIEEAIGEEPGKEKEAQKILKEALGDEADEDAEQILKEAIDVEDIEVTPSEETGAESEEDVGDFLKDAIGISAEELEEAEKTEEAPPDKPAGEKIREDVESEGKPEKTTTVDEQTETPEEIIAAAVFGGDKNVLDRPDDFVKTLLSGEEISLPRRRKKPLKDVIEWNPDLLSADQIEKIMGSGGDVVKEEFSKKKKPGPEPPQGPVSKYDLPSPEEIMGLIFETPEEEPEPPEKPPEIQVERIEPEETPPQKAEVHTFVEDGKKIIEAVLKTEPPEEKAAAEEPATVEKAEEPEPVSVTEAAEAPEEEEASEEAGPAVESPRKETAVEEPEEVEVEKEKAPEEGAKEEKPDMDELLIFEATGLKEEAEAPSGQGTREESKEVGKEMVKFQFEALETHKTTDQVIDELFKPLDEPVMPLQSLSPDKLVESVIDEEAKKVDAAEDIPDAERTPKELPPAVSMDIFSLDSLIQMPLIEQQKKLENVLGRKEEAEESPAPEMAAPESAEEIPGMEEVKPGEMLFEAEGEDAGAPLKKGAVVKDRYKILRILSEGEHKNTYAVKDVGITANNFVLKEIVHPPMTKSEYSKRRKLFYDALTLVSVYEHRNLLKVHQGFYEKGREYILTEKVQGLDLEKLAQMNVKGFAEKEVFKWGIHLCEAIEHIHEKPQVLTLGRLQPHHLMIEDSGDIKLTGYNLHRFFDPQGKPEKELCKPGDFSADVTSVARVLYFLLTKKKYEKGLGDEQMWPYPVGEKMKELLKTACSSGQEEFDNITSFKEALVETQPKKQKEGFHLFKKLSRFLSLRSKKKEKPED